jgi:hypothetical protein
MTRAAITYGDRVAPTTAFAGQNISTPTAGFFRHRLRSGSVDVGIRIWFGPPADPVTGEELDRSWRWQAQANGDPIDFDRVWPECARVPITEAEYRRFCARQRWAATNAPESAYAEPTRRLDLLSRSTPLPF